MIYYTFSESTTIDLEWWAVDINGQIAHFATAGFAGFPGKITIAEYDRLLDYFKDEAPAISAICESPDWRKLYGYIPEEDVTPKMPLEKRLYYFFHNKEVMCERGIYLYDTNPNSEKWSTYFRILIPTVPLLFHQLPEDIQKILDRVRIPISFAKEPMVLSEWVPERLLPDDTLGPAVVSIPGKP